MAFLSVLSPQLLPQTSQRLDDRFEQALAYIAQDDYDRAISQLQSVISQDDLFAQAYRILVEGYIFVDKLAEAQSYFDGLLKANPENPYAWYALGRLHFARKEYDPAIASLKRVIDLDPRFADAYSYRGGLPEVYHAKKELDLALKYFENLIEQDPANPCAHYGLARTFIRQHKWDGARQALEKALELDPQFGLAYHSMTYIAFRRGYTDKILKHSEKLLEVAERTADVEMLAYAKMMIGISHQRLGDYLKAMQFLSEALKHAQSIGDKRREGIILNNLATVYAISSNYTKALQYFKKALQLTRKSGAKRDEARTLINVGQIYKDQKMFAEALDYYQQALEIARERNYKRQQSSALSKIAFVYQSMGKYEKAMVLYRVALKTAREAEDRLREGKILYYLGSLNNDLGNFEIAKKHHQQALRVGRTIRNTQIVWVAEAGLGKSYQSQGYSQKAIKHFARAIALYDSVRETLDIESLASSFLEEPNRYQAYPAIVQSLAKTGQVSEAFLYAEKYKAKTLLHILSQRPFLFGELLSDSLTLELKTINSKYEKFHNLLSIERTKTEGNEGRLLELDQQATGLELQKAVILEHLRASHPAYRSLTSPEILSVDEIRHDILEEGQAIVEYVVGPRETSVFIVTKATLFFVSLPVGQDELHANILQLSQIFRSHDEKDRWQLTTVQSVDFSVLPAHNLYELLFKPLEPNLAGIDEVIIVPDDVLFYLPFEMLVSDTTGMATPYDFGTVEFLLGKYAISYVSAVSLLNPDLEKPRKAGKGVLAIGNPSFDLKKSANPSEFLLTAKEPTLVDNLRDPYLVSLPHAEAEVQAISKVMSRSVNRILVRDEATEDTFKRVAQNFQVLHLATHFILDDNQPLYSKIALTHEPDSQEDGFLQTYEVFNLNLNADLVVLSACETGLGKLRKGEGLIGISRAFLFAGVPSLVASLWQVDDESTAIIMKSFYEYLKKGLNKSQALRHAKLDYIAASPNQGKDPYYWAPFILSGNLDPMNFWEQSSRVRIHVVVITLLALLLAAIIVKRLYTLRRQSP